jgi:AraC-like DNA-binding protein
MSESASLITAFVHGIAAGGALVVGLAVWRSALSLHVRTATSMAMLSICCWMINEARPLWSAFGEPFPIEMGAMPVAGLFWLFVLTVFADWRVTPLTLLPAGVLAVSGAVMSQMPDETGLPLWVARNGFGALLAIHAGALIIRGWSGDLVERRRRFRALVLSLSCLLVVVEVAASYAHKLDPAGPWLVVAVGQPIGGLLVALLTLAISALALQVQPAAFGASRKIEPAADPRAEAADRLLMARLDKVMVSEAWRREGLAIGQLASDLEVPEHRLRRLINQRLGHRNFADFVNGYRIEAAKARLGDPAEARTTVAAIAFDLGYGSLGPFNRAFRAATGATPTEWRKQALQASPELQEAV